MSPILINAIVIVIILMSLIALSLFIYYKFRIIVGVDEAAIIYGRKSKSIDPNTGNISIVGSRIIAKGHGAFRNPILEKVQYINLQAIDISLKVENIQSKNGVKMVVDAFAVVKVGDDEFSVRKAITQFGDTKVKNNAEKLRKIMEETLQGYFRSIISTLTPEELQFERDKLHQQVQDAAGTPLASMGIDIITFTVKNVADKEGYLDMLKQGNVAKTEREQAVIVTKEKLFEFEAVKEKGLKEKSMTEELKRKDIMVAKQIELERIEAEREQYIASEEKDIAIAIIEKEKAIEEAEREKERRNLKEVRNKKDILKAELKAEEIKILAGAKADAVRMAMEGEADGKRKLADVYENLDDLARLILVMDELPDLVGKVLGKDGLASIFKEVAKPIGNIKDVKIYDFAGGNGESSLGNFAKLTPKIIKEFFTYIKELGISDDVIDIFSKKVTKPAIEIKTSDDPVESEEAIENPGENKDIGENSNPEQDSGQSPKGNPDEEEGIDEELEGE